MPWPGAFALARYLDENADSLGLQDCSAVELGAHLCWCQSILYLQPLSLPLALTFTLLSLLSFLPRQFKNMSVCEQEADIDLEKKEKACAWFTNYWKLWLLVFLTLCAIAYVEEKRREEKRREERRREITELYTA